MPSADLVIVFGAACHDDIRNLTAALRARCPHPIRCHCLAPTPGQAGASRMDLQLSRRFPLKYVF